jgi:predicted metal-binding protein
MGILAMRKRSPKEGTNKFQFLAQEVRRLGAIEAKIITPGKLAVEDRVVLKCKSECMEGTCMYPSMARHHALGVNVKKTLKNIGMLITFPFEKHPEGIGMLLID